MIDYAAKQANHYFEFEDYAADVVDEQWLHIAADDPRVAQVYTLLSLERADSDCTYEANLLAQVAEEYRLDSDEMNYVLHLHEQGVMT